MFDFSTHGNYYSYAYVSNQEDRKYLQGTMSYELLYEKEKRENIFSDCMPLYIHVIMME